MELYILQSFNVLVTLQSTIILLLKIVMGKCVRLLEEKVKYHPFSHSLLVSDIQQHPGKHLHASLLHAVLFFHPLVVFI